MKKIHLIATAAALLISLFCFVKTTKQLNLMESVDALTQFEGMPFSIEMVAHNRRDNIKQEDEECWVYIYSNKPTNDHNYDRPEQYLADSTDTYFCNDTTHYAQTGSKKGTRYYCGSPEEGAVCYETSCLYL